MTSPSTQKLRLFAPECIQTSAMDCGPASLKCLLEGFGVSVSYGRLREACQTEVDGTSIDTMEEVALQLGLDAEQNVIPFEHLFLQEAKALPAIVVISLPSGLTHFVVVWRRHGRFLQIMDPGTGRRWTTCKRFLNEEMFRHTLPVPAQDWREWAGSEEFLDPLKRRLKELALPTKTIENLLQTALLDENFFSLAALDAATRLVSDLADSKALSRGKQAKEVLETLFQNALSDQESVPQYFWTAYPTKPTDDGEEQVLLKGAVILRILGVRDPNAKIEGEEAPPLPVELARALEEKPIPAWRTLLSIMRHTKTWVPIVLLCGLFLAASGLVVEALLFRGLLGLVERLKLGEQRLESLSALLVFTAALLLLEIPITSGLLRLGRRLETQLRVAFLEKLPKISDKYFHSRLTSDMAERGHQLHVVRNLPSTAGSFCRAVFGLLLTTAGIAWLDPGALWITIIIAAVSVGLPILIQPLLSERDLRVRSHVGALSRFYLDSLLGLIAARTHGAENAIRTEHEGLLVEWFRSGERLLRVSVWVEGIQALVGFSLAAWLLFDHLARVDDSSAVLLLLYWALSLPALGQSVAITARQYPMYRNTTLRLLEILSAPEEKAEDEKEENTQPYALQETMTSGAWAYDVSFRERSPDESLSAWEKDAGVSLAFQNVSVRAGGRVILENVNLSFAPKSHVGIVGTSGAGKSTLVGLLLGWFTASSGRVLVDGRPLEGKVLEELRQQTAWVDPGVQLWNDSLLENICYGIAKTPDLPIGQVIDQSDLRNVLERLPTGLQTPLGEGGALVSGGEGQRIRLGRALLRPNVRLVILDEPFRGLDREKRRILLHRARLLWPKATLLCVTHDVGETRIFERVLVVEDGQVIEDGVPDALAGQENSRYLQLLEAEKLVRQKLWTNPVWRKFWLAGGQLSEEKNKKQTGPLYLTRRANEGKGN